MRSSKLSPCPDTIRFYCIMLEMLARSLSVIVLKKFTKESEETETKYEPMSERRNKRLHCSQSQIKEPAKMMNASKREWVRTMNAAVINESISYLFVFVFFSTRNGKIIEIEPKLIFFLLFFHHFTHFLFQLMGRIHKAPKRWIRSSMVFNFHWTDVYGVKCRCWYLFSFFRYRILPMCELTPNDRRR